MTRADARMWVSKGVFSLAVAGCVAACTPATPPRALNGGIETPDGWTANAADEAQPLEEGWLETFDDSRLEELVALAKVRNPDLRIAAARFAQADANARISFADKLPSLTANFTSTRLQSRFTAPNGQVGVVRQNQFSLNGEVNWELDVWGRVAAQVAAADADYQASAADLAAAQISLSANIARAYFNVVAAIEQLRLSQQTVESFDRSLRIVRSRYARGITDALDVRLTANSLESARALEVLRRSELDNNKRTLEILLADYPAGQVDVAKDLPKLPPLTGLGLPADLLSRRPDVQASYLRLAAADFRVAQSKRALLPQMTINATAGNQTEIFSDFTDFDSLVWRITGALAQPIFQGGRLKNAVKRDQAAAEEALASYTQTVLNAFEEVESALANDRLFVERERFSAQAVEQAAAGARLAEQQYSRGLTAILSLLDSQRRELDSRSQLIDVRAARAQNRVNLFLALGGAATKEETLEESL
ncbi:MAG: TolC family protein [Pseudomonadota bacterium]